VTVIAENYLQEHFSLMLVVLRTRAGMTQAELATAAQLEPSWVSQFERQNRLPSFAIFRRLVLALKCKPEELMGI
jgi:transcriptional regulator with XRE-family HTH domain